MRIAGGEHDASAGPRGDHVEEAVLVFEAQPVPVGLGQPAIERPEVEHRLGPGEAGEVPLGRSHHDHRVELEPGGAMGGQDPNTVGPPARRPLGQAGALPPSLEHLEERLDGAFPSLPRPGRGVGGRQNRIQVPPGLG